MFGCKVNCYLESVRGIKVGCARCKEEGLGAAATRGGGGVLGRAHAPAAGYNYVWLELLKFNRYCSIFILFDN